MALTVAVIMTCYNEGPYLGDAVRSVLDQTRADLIDEIVITDDGSDPATIAVLREIEGWDARIRVLYGSGGLGPSGQRRRAIAETRAPVLAILDGDDIWTLDKLERQLPVLAADEGAGLLYSDFYIFPDGDLAAARRAGVLDITQRTELLRSYFLNDPPIIPSTTLMRRNAYDAAGGFDAALHVFEDTDMFLRLAAVTRFVLFDAPVLYKRQRGTSITGGRRDLMAHHAFVALRAAASSPALLPLVPRRLGERARKLGNQRFLLNDRLGAVALLRLAVRLDPFNRRAWQSLVAAGLFPGLALRLLGASGRARQAAVKLA
jgi:glycosyltransferase involved in cell wall biosynthesis